MQCPMKMTTPRTMLITTKTKYIPTLCSNSAVEPTTKEAMLSMRRASSDLSMYWHDRRSRRSVSAEEREAEIIITMSKVFQVNESSGAIPNEKPLHHACSSRNKEDF